MSIDQQIGARLKRLRLEMAQDPKRLAAIISVTPEHYDAFEEGRKTMSAQVLFALSTYLEVPVSSFFDDLDLAALTRERR